MPVTVVAVRVTFDASNSVSSEESVYASASFTSFVMSSPVYVAVWSTAVTAMVIEAFSMESLPSAASVNVAVTFSSS